MKIQASFVQDGKWWVAWTDDIPGALPNIVGEAILCIGSDQSNLLI